MIQNDSPEITIYWFRRDLRLHDNAPLFHALKSGWPVLPLFIFDHEILKELPRNDPRVNFIYDELQALSRSLEKLGSTLLVYHSLPLDAWKLILESYRVRSVFAGKDYEPHAVERDESVLLYLENRGISVHYIKDQVIFEDGDVLKKDGSPYSVFTPYSRRWLEQFNPMEIPDYKTIHMKTKFLKSSPLPFPSLKSLGFSPSSIVIPKRTIPKKIIEAYDRFRDFPGHPDGTTHLGIHLRFGTISIRKLVKITYSLNHVYLRELIWREFFMSVLHRFPYSAAHSFRPEYDRIPWRNHPDEFEAWKTGRTGFPMVDA